MPHPQTDEPADFNWCYSISKEWCAGESGSKRI